MSGLEGGARDLMADLRASLDAAREVPVVADTTAGEAEDFDPETVTITLPPNPAARRHRLAARSGGAQDDGLRGRCEALAEELERGYVGTGGEWARGADYGLTVAAASLRRALAGPDDARQDGAR